MGTRYNRNEPEDSTRSTGSYNSPNTPFSASQNPNQSSIIPEHDNSYIINPHEDGINSINYTQSSPAGPNTTDFQINISTLQTGSLLPVRSNRVRIEDGDKPSTISNQRRINTQNPVFNDNLTLRQNSRGEKVSRNNLPSFNLDDSEDTPAFKPKREPYRKNQKEVDDILINCTPGGAHRCIFVRLVSEQLASLENRYSNYSSNFKYSWRSRLWKRKFQLLAIPLFLLLLWLVLLYGTIIGSVLCNGMQDCPYARGDPRTYYAPNSLF